ncbi:MAG: TolC family protein [Acidiferrobacterales bacterium]|nr:TolC family protein [Acidiferrobacterales bacterium]
MKFSRTIGFILGCIFTSGVFASDLLDIYQLALENDATLNSQKFATEASSLDNAIIRSRAFPTVSLRGRYEEQRIARSNEVNSTSGEVVLDVPLYMAELKPALDSAEADVVIGELRLQKARQDLYRRVVVAYFDVLASQDDLDTSASEVKAIAEFLKVTRTRFDVGLGTESDIQNATAREALARAAQIRDESAIEAAWISLMEITGSRPDQLNRLAENLIVPVLMPDNVEHWIDLALENNPDLAIQGELVNRSKYAIQAAGARTGPNVMLGLSRREFADKPRNPNPERSKITLSISKSFSVGGYHQKLRKQATLNHKAQVQRELAATQQVRSSVSRTYFNLVSLYNRIRALETARSASQIALDVTEQSFLVGTVASIDVLNARHDLFQVTRDLHRARYDYLNNSIVIRQLAGTLDLFDLEVMNNLLERP